MIIFSNFYISGSQLDCTSDKEKNRLMYKIERSWLDLDCKAFRSSHAFVHMQHVVAGGTGVLHVFAGINAEGDEAAGPASV